MPARQDNKVNEEDKLLQITMFLLNTTAFSTLLFVIWSVYSAFEKAGTIKDLLTGNFIP